MVCGARRQEQVIKIRRINSGYLHPSREIRANQLQRILDNPETAAEIAVDLQRSHIDFRRLEYLRISLAKHEIAGKKNLVAYAPGYARIHRDTGFLEFELANEKYIIGYITRRDITDEIRIRAAKAPPQSDDELASFDSFMKGAGDRPGPARQTTRTSRQTVGAVRCNQLRQSPSARLPV